MQAGFAATRHWMLEFPSETPCVSDPLMEWASLDETRTQVRLRFDTLAQALKYAQDHGWDIDLQVSRQEPPHPKSYAENFAWKRKTPWSH
jgi:hypothetical protein